MSKLGFDKLIRNLPNIKRQFLVGGIKLAQKEMATNFDSEINSESGAAWDDVVRDVPPKILVESGSMKKEALTNKPNIGGDTAVLVIDPTDKRGRNYAAYHQESPSQGNNVQRELVTQSSDLDNKQLDFLIKTVDKFLP